MQYVPQNTPGVSANQFGPGEGGFQDENAAAGITGTLFTSVLWNDILGNLMNIMAVAGIAPTAGRLADLSDSIAAIAAQRQIKLVNTANYQILAADNGKIIYFDTSGGALTTYMPDVTAMPAGFNVELRCEGPNALTVLPLAGSAQVFDAAAVASITVRAQRMAFVFGDTIKWRSAVRRSGLYMPGRAFITVSGTFTVPAGVTEIDVDVWGGGGGGSSALQTGGGGGPGGYAFKRCVVTPGQQFTCTIGPGGTPNNPGSSSSFDVLFSATGGGAGTTTGSAAAGVGVGGDYNGSGPYGGLYLGTGSSGSVPAAGGGSPFGAPSAPAGSAGTVPGGGGGGGGSAQSGGAGLIIVRW